MNQTIFERLLYTTGTVYVIARSAVLLLVFLLLFFQILLTISRVSGPSMESALKDGQYLIIDRLTNRLAEPKRGDVVVVRFPGDPRRSKYVKRIIGLPGERVAIRDGQILINGEPLVEFYLPQQKMKDKDREWLIGLDNYFLLGDNRVVSNDSRIFGPIERRFIIGHARLIVWPFNQAGLLEPVFYE